MRVSLVPTIVVLLAVAPPMLAEAAPPKLLFHAPYDGSVTGYIDGGRSAVPGLGMAPDIIRMNIGVTYEKGMIGQAAVLGKSGLRYPAESAFRREAGTISMWVRPRWNGNVTDQYHSFFGMLRWGLLYKYTDQTSVTFGTIKDDGFFDYGCVRDIADWRAGKWYHLAVTWDLKAGFRRLYIDGERRQTGRLSSLGPGTDVFVIGANYHGQTPADSAIDEVYVWDQPLPDKKIWAAYIRVAGGSAAWPTSPKTGKAPTTDVTETLPGLGPKQPAFVNWNLDDAWNTQTKTRTRWTLNGWWRFQPCAGFALRPPETTWAYIKVPSTWIGPFFDVLDADGKRLTRWNERPIKQHYSAWFDRLFHTPKATEGNRVTLTFDCVRALATAYLNGRELGEVREWERTSFDVAPLLRPDGMNRLSVFVSVPINSDSDFRGISQDVWLTVEPARRPTISDVFAKPSVKDMRLDVQMRVRNPQGAERKAKVVADVFETNGTRPVLRFEPAPVDLAPGTETYVTVSAPWPNPSLWSPENPHLYLARARLEGRDGQLLDEAPPVRFGFREFEIAGGEFRLNGHRALLRGESSPPFQYANFCHTPELIRSWFKQLKAVGMNCVRLYNGDWTSGESCHARELVFSIADEMGIILLPNGPGVRKLYDVWDSAEVRRRFEKRLGDYVERYRNHPSVVMWFVNFNLGAHTGDIHPVLLDGESLPTKPPYPERHFVMKDNAARMRAHDPTRPVFHHAAGSLGSAITTMSYLGFGLPLQEREEWPSAWAQRKPKPLMPVETGFPCILSWFRGRRGSLMQVYSADPLFVEYAAAYLGDRAYRITDSAMIRAFSDENTYRRLGFLRKNSPAYDEVKALFAKSTLRAWRTYGISGYCHHAELPDCFATTVDVPIEGPSDDPRRPGMTLDHGPASWSKVTQLSRLGEAMRDNNSPLLVYVAGAPGDFPSKDHAYFADERIVKQIVVANDSTRKREIGVTWDFVDVVRKQPRFSGSVDVTAEPGEIKKAPFGFRPPQVGSKFRYAIRLTAREDDKVVARDLFEIQVFPTAARPKWADARIALIDESGDTAKLMKQAGLKFAILTKETRLTDFDLLVIGRNSFTAAARDLFAKCDAGAAVQDGLKVLCFEQTEEMPLGLRLDQQRVRNAFVRDPASSILKGLSHEDLANWRGASNQIEAYPSPPDDVYERWPEEFYHWGNRGMVATCVIEKPQAGNFRVLADAGFDLLFTPLLEVEIGKGLILLCQLDVTDRYAKDPVATTIVHRLFSRLLAYEPARRTGKAAYRGDATVRETLTRLGIATVEWNADAKADSTCLVVGGDVRADLEKQLDPIKAFLDDGGTVVCLGKAAADAHEWLPIQSRSTARSVFCSDFDTPRMPLLRGVGPSDFFWREIRDVRVPIDLPTGARAVDSNVVAEIPVGKGRVVLCSILPSDFDDARPRTKTLRLLAAIFSNLGLAAVQPGNWLQPGAGYPYVEQALVFNPHKYRRW